MVWSHLCEAAWITISASKSEATFLEREKGAWLSESWSWVREGWSVKTVWTHWSISIPTLNSGFFKNFEPSWEEQETGNRQQKSVSYRVGGSLREEELRGAWSWAAASPHWRELAEVPQEVFQAGPIGRRPQGKNHPGNTGMSTRLAWGHLGILLEELEEVWGVEKVRVSLLRLLPCNLASMDGQSDRHQVRKQEQLYCSLVLLVDSVWLIVVMGTKVRWEFVKAAAGKVRRRRSATGCSGKSNIDHGCSG